MPGIWPTTDPDAPALYIGMMSGTSVDGVDAVLARTGSRGLTTIASASLDIDDALRATLLALQASGPDEIVRAGVATRDLTDLYAEAVDTLLRRARALPDYATLAPGDVAAIGAHGQTIRHRPELGFTVQLLDGARLAVRTGITVVNDLRSADIAAGGQGAPLAPGFHDAVFRANGRRRVIVNIGGIANVTRLAPGEPALGFDTGPGNVLMDGWTERHLGSRYDAGGAWAASAPPDPALLRRMLSEPYFALPAPKSTGRDLFDIGWLDDQLARHGERLEPAVVQATLCELTTSAIADAIRGACGGADEVLVCGGGARNAHLMDRLAGRLAPASVGSTEAVGIDPQAVEALAFAWLARQRLHGRPGNLPTVTGASRPVVLGAVHAP
ncbi:MAG: anhydro-N-acetylmuramic acid kinase [Burkholderiaceae bacterium]